jgi:hypothetical protein
MAMIVRLCCMAATAVPGGLRKAMARKRSGPAQQEFSLRLPDGAGQHDWQGCSQEPAASTHGPPWITRAVPECRPGRLAAHMGTAAALPHTRAAQADRSPYNRK